MKPNKHTNTQDGIFKAIKLCLFYLESPQIPGKKEMFLAQCKEIGLDAEWMREDMEGIVKSYESMASSCSGRRVRILSDSPRSKKYPIRVFDGLPNEGGGEWNLKYENIPGVWNGELSTKNLPRSIQEVSEFIMNSARESFAYTEDFPITIRIGNIDTTVYLSERNDDE